jgi:hypothetical protein
MPGGWRSSPTGSNPTGSRPTAPTRTTSTSSDFHTPDLRDFRDADDLSPSEPFDAFAIGATKGKAPEKAASAKDKWSPGLHAAPDPYVPEPAIRPLPPEAIPEPRSGETPGRRGPLTPEPHAVSAPLPQPEPISPPLEVSPARDAKPTIEERGRKASKRRQDDDFVDWVSGLGTGEE